MATVARTKQDVDNMTKQERLWDSLNHAYGQQREASDRSFDKAYSQADRQALSRGMQRSSYNAQNLAGINNQKIRAQNDIWNNQIADYENRLGTLEQQEAEAERWERQFNASREDAKWNRDFQQKQFDAGREDVAWNRAFQQKQADTANQQWQLNFDASRADTAFNQGMQEKQFAANQDQNAWQRGMTERQYADSRADTAWQQGMTERQYADNRADTAWNQEFQQKQFDANQAQNEWQRGMTEQQYADSRADTAWQQGMTERQYADSRADTVWNQNFQQAEADRAAEQWERAFEQSNMTDDQKLAAGYVASIIAAGNTPSDELLARAGLSREDAEAMKSSITGNSGGGPGPSNPGSDTPPADNPDDFLDDDLGNTGTLSDRLKGISNFLTRNGGVTATPGITAGGPYTPPSARSIRVQSPDAYKDAFEGQITGDGQLAIAPTEIEPQYDFSDVDVWKSVDLGYGETDDDFDIWDVLEDKNKNKSSGLSKTNNGAGGKIKSTTVKKSN